MVLWKMRLLSVLVACATPGCWVGYLHPGFMVPSEARERVEEAAIRYNGALRFGNMPMAMQWVKPELQRPLLDLFGDGSKQPIRFTDVDIQSISLGPERDEARVLLLIRLYRLPSLTERTITDEQIWRYDPARLNWVVEPNLEQYASIGVEPARGPGPAIQPGPVPAAPRR